MEDNLPENVPKYPKFEPFLVSMIYSYERSCLAAPNFLEVVHSSIKLILIDLYC